MNRLDTMTSRALVLPLVLALGACAGNAKKSESLSQVDDLLARVERVHVETVVARETAHGALGSLHALLAPGFSGDPTAAHGELMANVARAEDQARTLRSAVEPMARTAERLFERWSRDLQEIGNSKLRQRSQTRLEETRARYNDVIAAAKASQIAFEAFNSDLRDHALFLGNDFNSATIAEMRPEMRALTERLKELDERFAATSNVAQSYVQAFALPGQIQGDEAAQGTPKDARPAGTQARREAQAKQAD